MGGPGSGRYPAGSTGNAHEQSKVADKATKKADASGTKADHLAAAVAHQAAADAHKALYSPTLAHIHSQMAAKHLAAAAAVKMSDVTPMTYSCDCGMEMSFSNQSRCMSCGRDVDVRKLKPAKLSPAPLKNIGVIPDSSAAPAAPGGSGE